MLDVFETFCLICTRRSVFKWSLKKNALHTRSAVCEVFFFFNQSPRQLLCYLFFRASELAFSLDPLPLNEIPPPLELTEVNLESYKIFPLFASFRYGCPAFLLIYTVYNGQRCEMHQNSRCKLVLFKACWCKQVNSLPYFFQSSRKTLRIWMPFA